MPTKDAPTNAHERSVTRSPSRSDDSSTITTVASVPISATSATVVSFTAVNPSPMSAAKSTPPAAQARNAAHENRRRVATIAVNEISDPRPQSKHREGRPRQVAPFDEHRPPRPDECGKPHGRDPAAPERIEVGHPPIFPAAGIRRAGGVARLDPDA